jgi:hypothetical protein
MRSLPLYNLFALSNFFLCEDEARDGAVHTARLK